MEKKNVPLMTPFDEMTSSKTLQTLKLLLPYTPFPGQHMLGVMIRFMELWQTISTFRGFPANPMSRTGGHSASPLDLINDFKPYLSEEDAEMMEQMSGVMQMMEMVQMTQNSEKNTNPMDMMMSMMNPEQQEMFRTYNSMFSDTMNQMEHSEKEDDT